MAAPASGAVVGSMSGRRFSFFCIALSLKMLLLDGLLNPGTGHH